MVLVRIVGARGEDEIRVDLGSQGVERLLRRLPSGWQVAVAQPGKPNVGTGKEPLGSTDGLVGTLTGATEDQPRPGEGSGRVELQQRTSAPDLDVVGMCAHAHDAERVVGQVKGDHEDLARWRRLVARRGSPSS